MSNSRLHVCCGRAEEASWPYMPTLCCPTVRADSHKQRFSTSQPTAELQPVKTNVHRAVDIPTSAAASIKLELWPLRNPVSSIQPLIYADPPNVLTGNDRLNIHRFAAIHLAFLLKCTQGLFELSLLSSHFLRTSPRVDRNFSQISRPCKQCQGSPTPTQLRSSASEDLTLFPMLSALWAQLNWLRLRQEG